MVRKLIHHPDGRKNYQPEWSDEQVEELRKLRRNGWSMKLISTWIGKSENAIKKKWSKIRD